MNDDQINSQTVHDGVHHSKPIPISTQHLRHRSTSFSSDSTNSPASSPPLLTPSNFPNTRIPVSSSSPILYFLSQSSPTKNPATFPFRGFVPPVVEDQETDEHSPPAQHARRASTAGRFQPQPPALEPHHERGVNVLRRLSLSGRRPFDTPQSSPSSGVSSPPKTQSNRKFGRSATLSEHTRTRRVPSPMGERMLKGHFDGFN